ncbi:MAG TPA: response regulator transcription factor [Nitrospiraceae bacterium]|nr:response regulator transcription factor [Nitrospiraceae bacterium]
MFRLFIADDHAIIRQGIRGALTDMVIVGEVSTAAELLHRLPSVPCDVLLLDVALPDASGMDIIPKIKAICPYARIIVFTMFSEPVYARRALGAGAAGYVLKTSPMTELRTAIRRVIAGQSYFSVSFDEDDLQSGPPRFASGQLSRRELQVLQRIAAGHTMGDIAKSLGLSPKTIATHRARILEKLELSSTAALIRYALRGGQGHNL